jgi:hypothetical protein
MTVKLRIPIPRDLWAQVEEDVPLYEPVSRDDLGRILNNRGIADWGQIARMQGSLVVTPRYRYFVLEVIKEDGTLIRAAFGTEFSPGVKREGFSSPSVL